MKNLNLLVWLTQLGLGIALPPVVFILLALWLRDSYGWGSWVLWAGIALGIVCAIDGLRTGLRSMERLSRDDEKEDKPVSYNNHD